MTCRNTANIKFRDNKIKNVANELPIVSELRKMFHHSDVGASEGWST